MREFRNHLVALDELWESHAKGGELSNALNILIDRGLYGVWLIEQDEDAVEVEKLEEEVENEVKSNGLETAEEFDWTSTSTLE
jgi:hypothetical protein